MATVRIITVLLLAAGSALHARNLPVCIENPSGLFPETLKVFQAALERYESKLGVDLQFQACGEGVVRLRIQPTIDPGQQADALGAIRVAGGAMQPEIQIFRESIRKMLLSQLPAYEGAAMAIVAAHELAHFLSQREDHDHSGWFQSTLTPARLMLAASGKGP